MRTLRHTGPTRERRPQIEKFYQATDATRAEVAREFQREYEAEAKRRREEKDRKFLAGDNRFYSEVNAAAGPFALPKENPEKLYLPESVEKLARLRPELEALKKSGPPEPPLACGVAEGDPVDQRVFVRGNPDAKGDPVPKRFPRVIAGENQTPIEKGSGRMELAPIESAHCPRIRQSCVAVAFRRRLGPHAQQFRKARRTAIAS